MRKETKRGDFPGRGTVRMQKHCQKNGGKIQSHNTENAANKKDRRRGQTKEGCKDEIYRWSGGCPTPGGITASKTAKGSLQKKRKPDLKRKMDCPQRKKGKGVAIAWDEPTQKKKNRPFWEKGFNLKGGKQKRETKIKLDQGWKKRKKIPLWAIKRTEARGGLKSSRRKSTRQKKEQVEKPTRAKQLPENNEGGGGS